MTMTACVTVGGRKRRTESFKSPSISSAHRNHIGERGGGGKEYWVDSRNEGVGRCVCLWGGMVGDGRGYYEGYL